jgi:hypothetical protein
LTGFAILMIGLRVLGARGAWASLGLGNEGGGQI